MVIKKSNNPFAGKAKPGVGKANNQLNRRVK